MEIFLVGCAADSADAKLALLAKEVMSPLV